MARRNFIHQVDDFLGAPTAAGDIPGRTTQTTQTGGSPSVLHVDGSVSGEVAMTLDATDEEQAAAMDFGNVLCLALALGLKLTFYVKVDSVLPTDHKAWWGLIGDFQDDPDDLAQCIIFRIDGDGAANALKIDIDDGTTRTTKDTGKTLPAGEYFVFEIDARNKKDVKFTVNGDPVLRSEKFDASLYTGSFQIGYCNYKAQSTGTAVLTVDYEEYEGSRPLT